MLFKTKMNHAACIHVSCWGSSCIFLLIKFPLCQKGNWKSFTSKTCCWRTFLYLKSCYLMCLWLVDEYHHKAFIRVGFFMVILSCSSISFLLQLAPVYLAYILNGENWRFRSGVILFSRFNMAMFTCWMMGKDGSSCPRCPYQTPT